MLLIGMCFINNLLYKNCPKDCHKFMSYLPKDITCGLQVVTVYRRYYLDKLTGKHVFLLGDWLRDEIVMYQQQAPSYLIQIFKN